MHGMIHVIFKNFVVDTFGKSAWEEILKRAGVKDDSTILQMQQYDDSLTMAAVKIGAEVAGAPLDAALELFGGYFVEFAAKNGFLSLLKSLGANLQDLLSNLNILHHNIERDFSTAIFPLFEVEKEGDSTGSASSFILLYASTRPGLHPLLRGALHKAADLLFHSELEIEVLGSRRARGSVSTRGPGAEGTTNGIQGDKGGTMAGIQGDQGGTMEDCTEGQVYMQWKLTVRPKVRGAPDVAEPAKQDTTGPRFGFFDLHAALASLWACNCKIEAPTDSEIRLKPQPPSDDSVMSLVISDLESKREVVESIHGHVASQDSGTEHPYLKLNALDRVKVGHTLFRGVEACKISAPWTDEEKLSSATEFWARYDKLDSFYAMSQDWLRPGAPKKSKMYFLSQSWGVPKEWDDFMGTDSSYSQAKAAEICCVAKDIAARELGSTDRWEQVAFWLDKCCIPQGDTVLMSWCVNLLEEFIVFCDGLIVLLPWTYFTRLWCVYEWVCFLLIHDPMNIEICADPFIRDSTIPLYVDCIQNFQLDKCQCFHEPDRAILLAKVNYYYKSKEAFEKFLKFTSIALFVRCVASRRSGKAASALKPWLDLARACGFQELESKIARMVQLLPKWRAEAVDQVKGGATHDVQSMTLHKVDEWFKADLVPLITKARSEAVAEKGLAYIKELKRAAATLVNPADELLTEEF